MRPTATALLVAALLSGAPAQPAAPPIPSSGLLPIYGADLPIASLEAAWEAAAGAGFGTVRFEVDVADSGAPGRLTALCAWAADRRVSLLPVLTSAAIDAGFAAAAAAVVGAAAGGIRSASPDRDDAYGCIHAYQIGGPLNDPVRGGGIDAATAQLRVLQAAAAVRKAEADALAGSGLAATPLAASASFDAPLIAAGLQAPAPLGDEERAAAFAALSSYLGEIAASPDIDWLAVDYRPGSAGAGDAPQLAALADDLAAAFPDKSLVLSTGMPGDLGSAEAQQRFYALAFATMADARVAAGPDSRLLGVVLDGVTEEPAQQALATISEAVGDAQSETVPDATPNAPEDDVSDGAGGESALVSGAKERLQQFLFGLLDRSLEKIGDGLFSGEPADADHGDYADPGGGLPEPAIPPAMPSLSVGKIYVAPDEPIVGHPVKISVGIVNASPDTAAEGLTVALVDQQGALLATAPGGTAAPAVTTMVDVKWTPASPGPVTMEAIVADEQLMEVARSAPTPVFIAPGPLEIVDALPGQATNVNPGALAHMPFPLPFVMSFTAGDMNGLTIGQPASAVVSLRNPYGRALDALDLTLTIDGQRAATHTLRAMAAGQVRSIVFPVPAFASAGAHELRVAVASADRASSQGDVRLQVDVRARASSAPPARTAGESPPARTLTPPTRDIREPAVRRPARPLPRPSTRRPDRSAPPARRAPAFDLRVTGLATAPARVVAGQPFALRVSVRNTGTAPSPAAQVTCASGRAQTRAALPVMPPGQQRDAICQLRAPALARFGVAVTVAAAGDTDPSNNRASITVTPLRRRGR